LSSTLKAVNNIIEKPNVFFTILGLFDCCNYSLPVEKHEEPDHLPGQVNGYPGNVFPQHALVVDFSRVELTFIAFRNEEKPEKTAVYDPKPD